MVVALGFQWWIVATKNNNNNQDIKSYLVYDASQPSGCSIAYTLQDLDLVNLCSNPPFLPWIMWSGQQTLCLHIHICKIAIIVSTFRLLWSSVCKVLISLPGIIQLLIISLLLLLLTVLIPRRKSLIISRKNSWRQFAIIFQFFWNKYALLLKIRRG